VTEEYGHISDAFDNLPEEELLMTEEQKELYDIIADWWDKIFTEPTKGRSACIIDLVNSIIESKNK
jgi:hypothetical protein